MNTLKRPQSSGLFYFFMIKKYSKNKKPSNFEILDFVIHGFDIMQGVRMNPLIVGRLIIFHLILSGIFLLGACRIGIQLKEDPESGLYQLLDNEEAGIDFINQVEYTEEYNTYTYRNFYNGAGVGLGDFNKDGLIDVYFCGNIRDNRLYLNKGNLHFEDITEKAGVACPGVWSTGVSIVDINGDGWLDIYVCKSGIMTEKNRNNELFINNGDLTFSERSKEYGIDELGLSTQAAFFDYDKDGDLDMYLLNNSFKSIGGYEIKKDQREVRDPEGGNKFYRNDQGHFIDITEEAGIYGSIIGFGLGVSVSDINGDGWLDLYISNDFFEKDYLYINNHDGTFSEKLEDYIRELSLGSMGADIADINNDAFQEIFVTEMVPEPESRLKTKSTFETWDEYQSNLGKGYYHQFARNVLQLNNGNGSYSEIGRLAGVATTDWSWGALIFDMNNDGWKDIFVANGIYKDLLDQDYLNFYSNPAIVRNLIQTEEHAILTMIHDIPSVRVPNYAFKNEKDLTFTNMAEYWGLGLPSHSNGAAYGDLDNDGDLDLVINNVNMPPFIYNNLTSERDANFYIGFKLAGDKQNSHATGSRVTVFSEGEMFFQELMPVRGFQSTMDDRLIFGLGKHQKVDSVWIEWWDDRYTKLYGMAANQMITLDIKDAVNGTINKKGNDIKKIFEDITDSGILDFRHIENEYVDFTRENLLFHMNSNEGPKMGMGDLNGDGLEDIVIGGAKDEPAYLFLQKPSGKFENQEVEVFEQDKTSEDTDCLIFDADNDGDNDIYMASGGHEFSSSSTALIDRLYLNDGKGNFIRSDQLLPTNKFETTSCVEAADYDHDNDLDLAVGIRLKPFAYGVPVNGYILQNDGNGRFRDITSQVAPGLSELGLITDLTWADIDGDQDDDLLVVGEFMPITVFLNNDGIFENRTTEWGLQDSNGWWKVIEKEDLDHDGDIDFVVGNHGWNSRFKSSRDHPLTMYVSDFDHNGSIEQIICQYNGENSYPMVMRDDIVGQIPSLAKKYPDHSSYKEQTIQDIFSPEQLKDAIKLDAFVLSTSILINQGNGSFKCKSLPVTAQITPVYAIQISDFDNDGNNDVLLGGNLSKSKPEVGIYDASYGVLLKGNGKGEFSPISYEASGFFVKGEIRDFKKTMVGNRDLCLVAVNNKKFKVFMINK